MQPDVALFVNGRDYGGWKAVRVSRSIEQIAGTFDLGASQLWPGGDVETRNINPGDKCAVKVLGETVITGLVDDVKIGHSGDRHDVSVSGRDATADLVDCSIEKAQQWINQRAERIFADVCKPFKINVRVDVPLGAPLSSWAVQPGESAFENLERLARDRGVLLVSDGQGGLLVTRAGTSRAATALELGQNILAADGTLSLKERYSKYIVNGERQGTDLAFADSPVLKAEAVDQVVRDLRKAQDLNDRPLVVLHEDQADVATLKRRAEWERNVRAGRSIDIRVKVQGWSHPGGVWKPNQIVNLKDRFLRLEQGADLLIKGVTFGLDDSGGTITELALTMPEAFALIPLPKKPDNWWALAKIAPPAATSAQGTK